jgi:hypothetical protein
MRILCLVILFITALVGALVGGGAGVSGTVGPLKERIATMEKTAGEARELGKLTGKMELAGGKNASEASDLVASGVRGYKMAVFGGAAIAIINIALIVLAIRRRSKQILIVGGIGAALGIAIFALTPPRMLDDTLYAINVVLVISVVGSALFAFLADKTGKPAVPAPARLG